MKLSAVPAPAINPDARARGLHRALIALRQRQASGVPLSPAVRTRPLRAVMLACGAGMLAAAALLFQGTNMVETPAPKTADADVWTLAQMQALFSGQLNAVIERNGNVQLDLAGRPSTLGTEQPLLVQLERGDQRLRVLSYSGRRITLELTSGSVTFDALVTGEGEVVLLGRDFAWSSARPAVLAGYRINAQSLIPAL